MHVPEAQALEKVPRLLVDVDGPLVEGAHLGHEVETALALLLLKLQTDVPHGSLRDALHQVGGESRDLVPHALRGGDGDLVDDALVRVEVEGETGVVLLDDGPGGLLDGLGSDSLSWSSSRGDQRVKNKTQTQTVLRLDDFHFQDDEELTAEVCRPFGRVRIMTSDDAEEIGEGERTLTALGTTILSIHPFDAERCHTGDAPHRPFRPQAATSLFRIRPIWD